MPQAAPSTIILPETNHPPLFRTLVKVVVASLIVGTVLAHFGITAEQIIRELGLSTERIEDYARQGIAWV